MEEVWCNLGEAGGWRVTLGRSNAAELGSRQDKALKPWVAVTKASHYFRLMLPEMGTVWVQKTNHDEMFGNSHIGAYVGYFLALAVYLGLYGTYFARLRP